MKCLDKSNVAPEMRHLIGKKKFSREEYNSLFPIVGYRVMDGGIMIHRECALDSLKEMRTGRRQKVTSLSSRSLSRLALLALSTPTQFKSILTVTYGQNYPLKGEKVKYHLNHFLTKLRRSYGQFDYLWFLEFQSRGAPHFHILTTLAPPNKVQRSKISHMWADIVEPQNWPYEAVEWVEDEAKYKGQLFTNEAVWFVNKREKHLAKLKHEFGARRYVVKYATKLKQKIVPKNYRNVGRFWGKASG